MCFFVKRLYERCEITLELLRRLIAIRAKQFDDLLLYDGEIAGIT